MIRRRLLRFVLLALLFFGAVGLVGRWSYSAGWTRGYFDRQATQVEAAPAEDAPPTEPQVAPNPAPGPYSYYGPGFAPFGWFFAGLLKFAFFLLLAGFLFRLFLGWRWRRGGHWRHWGKRPFAHHGPYSQDPHAGGPYEKRPEDVEPDIRTI